MGAEILAPTGIRSPDLPARSESLHRLSYPGPNYGWYTTELETQLTQLLFKKCAVDILTIFSVKCGRGLSKALTVTGRSNVDIAELKMPWIKLYGDVLIQGGANVTLHGLSVVKHRRSSYFCATLCNVLPCKRADAFWWPDSPDRRVTRKV